MNYFYFSVDILFYVVGSSDENELILVNTLTTFFDTVSHIVRKNVEKKAVFDKMDYIILAADEFIEDGGFTFGFTFSFTFSLQTPFAYALGFYIL